MGAQLSSSLLSLRRFTSPLELHHHNSHLLDTENDLIDPRSIPNITSPTTYVLEEDEPAFLEEVDYSAESNDEIDPDLEPDLQDNHAPQTPILTQSSAAKTHLTEIEPDLL